MNHYCGEGVFFPGRPIEVNHGNYENQAGLPYHVVSGGRKIGDNVRGIP